MAGQRKRKPIPKSVRFEVFKRDKFTCQYCGAKAPDVILEVDHIQPVSKGGTDDIFNLITACRACNSGKGDRQLSETATIDKQRRQLEELQERKEQIEMLFEWQRSLQALEDQVVDQLASYWEEKTPGLVLSDVGRQDLRKLVRKFGLSEVMEAMNIAADYYLRFDDEGNATPESFNIAFSKLGGICMNRRREREDPNIRRIYYIRGIARNRCGYFDDRRALILLQQAVEAGADLDELEVHAKSVRSWSEWRRGIEDYIDELLGLGGE